MHVFTARSAAIILALAALALTSGFAAAAQPNLVVDGDFSAAPNPGGFATYAKGSKAITGWTVTKASVDLIGTYWSAPHGARSVDLDGTPGFGAIAQSFRTVPGAKYVLTFLLSANDQCAPTIKHLHVTVAAAATNFSVNASTSGVGNHVWALKTVPFKASRPMTTLQFASADTTGGQCGPVVATIKVVKK
jgi:choice-of-anchor C domain-containing protein